MCVCMQRETGAEDVHGKKGGMEKRDKIGLKEAPFEIK